MSADLEANVEVVEDARGIAVIERYLGTAIYQNNKFPDWKSNHLTEGHERSDYDNYYYIVVPLLGQSRIVYSICNPCTLSDLSFVQNIF